MNDPAQFSILVGPRGVPRVECRKCWKWSRTFSSPQVLADVLSLVNGHVCQTVPFSAQGLTSLMDDV